MIERTTGLLAQDDGTFRQMPAAIIGADDARIIRDAFWWYLHHSLEPELFCDSCFDHSRDSKVEYRIDAQELQFICQCAIRFHKGAWLTPTSMAPSLSAPVDATGPVLMQLSADAARLLRHYKHVLLSLGLKQALRCNACYELGQPDGCDAQTTDSQILIRCRCTRRVYRGMSV